MKKLEYRPLIGWIIFFLVFTTLLFLLIYSFNEQYNSDNNDNDDDNNGEDVDPYWGVDSASSVGEDLYQCVNNNFGKPEVWGRY